MKKLLAILLISLVPAILQVSAATATAPGKDAAAKAAPATAKPSAKATPAPAKRKPKAAPSASAQATPTPAPKRGFLLFRWLFGEPAPTPAANRSAAIPPGTVNRASQGKPGAKKAGDLGTIAAPTPAVPKARPTAKATPPPKATAKASPTPAPSPKAPKAAALPKAPKIAKAAVTASTAPAAAAAALAITAAESDAIKARYAKAREEASHDFRVTQLREQKDALGLKEPFDAEAYKAAAEAYIRALFARIRDIDAGLNVPSITLREDAYIRRIARGKLITD